MCRIGCERVVSATFQDLELLSEEVVRLSKVQAGASSNGGSDRMNPCDPVPAETILGAEGS